MKVLMFPSKIRKGQQTEHVLQCPINTDGMSFHRVPGHPSSLSSDILIYLSRDNLVLIFLRSFDEFPGVTVMFPRISGKRENREIINPSILYDELV
ncbi:hypothetical protein TNCV_4544721 [Trichonephila clavipes]|nr:hypothetical protein TNCV_4544721 [Trichonephila clavipes]